MKKYFLLALFSFILFEIYAQSNAIIPPSPEVENFMNFINNPVNVKTGSCNVEVPLYEMKCGSLTLPISLNYYSNGRRSYEMNGPVGLGWMLNTGGMISRVVYGKRDDDVFTFPTPIPDPESISNKNNWDFLAGISGSVNWSNIMYDTQYDIFSFNFNGTSGNFILKDVNNVKVPEVIPKRKLKISLHKTTTPVDMIDYFEITDEMGVFYRFGKSMISNENNRENTGNYISAWFISEIISPDKLDTIHFKYNVKGDIRLSYYEMIKVRDLHDFTGLNPGQVPIIYDISSQEETDQIYYSSARIKEISYKDHKVVFEQKINSDLIDKMIISSKGEMLKTIIFQKSILDSPVGLYTFSVRDKVNYRLDNVVFQDKFNIEINKYIFEYYPSSNFNVRENDWWGYYNGPCTSPYYLIPRCTILTRNHPMQPLTPTEIGHIEADREPDCNYAISGILKSVTYPTGGKSEFFYESNQYLKLSPPSQISPCGGVRISKIVHSVDAKVTKINTYKYGDNENGYGFINCAPDIGMFGYEQSTIRSALTDYYCLDESVLSKEYLRVRYYSSDILPQYKNYFDDPVLYPQITIYEGTPEGNNGRTVYKYETVLDYLAVLGPKYESPMNSEIDYSINRKHEKLTNLWRNNELLEKNVYDKNNSLINQELYEYEHIPGEDIIGLHAERYYEVPQSVGMEQCFAGYGYPVFIYDSYTISTGVKRLKIKTDILYTGTGSFVNQTNYFYNNDYLISKTEKDASNGIYRTNFYYPNDYSFFGNLINNNMYGLYIDQRSYLNNRLISGIQTNYNQFGQPLEIYNFESSASDIQLIASNPFTFTKKQTISYNNDKNPEKVDVTDNLKTYYLWAYNKQYPVAKIESNDNALPVTNIQASIKGLTLSGSTIKANIDSDIANIRSAITPGIISANMVTIYTYKPQVGITSETDPAGRTTYYEYDSFSRLKLIKDQDGNIVEKYDYHYANQ